MCRMCRWPHRGLCPLPALLRRLVRHRSHIDLQLYPGRRNLRVGAFFRRIMALIVQKTKSRQGQANPILYRLAAAQQYSKCDGSNTQTLPASTCIFNDVTSGNSAIPGEPNFGKAGALYQAGPGYDLATGLGSVNVTNLVNAWESVTFNPTATSLAINPVVLKHGSAVNVQIAVTPQSGSGIPTGDVSLIASNGPGAGRLSLSNGSVSSTTSSLAGGIYNVTAHYAGDGTFAPSDSAPVPVSISPETSTTTAGAIAVLVPNAFYSGGIYGKDSVAFSARVASHSGQGIPTGVVTFTENGAPVAGGAASPINTEGQALTTNTSIVLPPGQHSIVATYAGDASFLPSLSSPALITITQAPTAISVQPNVGSAQSGKPVTSHRHHRNRGVRRMATRPPALWLSFQAASRSGRASLSRTSMLEPVCWGESRS